MNKQSNLYANVILTMFRSKHHLIALCEPHDITFVQGILLTLITPGEAKTMHELSSLMACDASNITGLVDKLDQNKFITRKPDENDRRIKVVSLTKKGEHCREKILNGLQDAEALDTKNLSEKEREQLGELLGKLLGTNP